jgi:hypothetical protein
VPEYVHKYQQLAVFNIMKRGQKLLLSTLYIISERSSRE